MSAVISFVRSPITWIAFAFAAMVLVYGYREIAKQFVPPTPPLPDLLRGATAGSGTSMSCEMTNIETASHSPEIMARLRERFPVGSRATNLQSYLESEGFIISSPCPKDHAILTAVFEQKRGGGLSYPARAEIWWKVEDVSLAWLTANIWYTGL